MRARRVGPVVKLFRREWVFPLLVVAFIGTAAEPTQAADDRRSEIAAQAVGEMHCNSVDVFEDKLNQYLVSGCGREEIYTCDTEGPCVMKTEPTTGGGGNSGGGDDDGVGDAVTDMACACASAGLASHGSHHASSSSSSHHHQK